MDREGIPTVVGTREKSRTRRRAKRLAAVFPAPSIRDESPTPARSHPARPGVREPSLPIPFAALVAIPTDVQTSGRLFQRPARVFPRLTESQPATAITMAANHPTKAWSERSGEMQR